MSGMKPGLPEPRVGDEVLIRGRVKEFISGVGANVELFSKTDQYRAWVRSELIEQVIPVDQTRTFKGFTVGTTWAAIGLLNQEIEATIDLDLPDDIRELAVASLEGARADLVAQLNEIGIGLADEDEP